ncbi:hypothetical protein ABKV87_20605 [Enterobacter hormaechei]|uniref:hypothetical protein n=1 Tax=Enterobacter cloacae complex sp. IR5401 TaxID=3412357 RepID=UPI0032B091FE
MTQKCAVIGKHITPCELLGKALEYGNPTKKSKGAFLPERVSMATGLRGMDIAQLHSGHYVGRGMAMNFCPFCGESLKTWEVQ